ncbi:unnamed protein product [Colias eurytheme]|nr:unnamed protein product [Colias eurytheme]
MAPCSIINCANTTKKVEGVNENIFFHRFPKDSLVKNKWIEATGRKNWFPTKHSLICSIHFHEDSFTGPSKFRRMLSG